MQLPPLSLYVHIPWCIRKCPYCDFNSHAAGGELPEQEYITTLLWDLAASAPWAQGRPLQSVFIGGGTPSLFSPEAIDRLITGIDAILPLAAQAEVTIEANPGAADEARFHGYRGAGVNRLSIGAQSFNDTYLQSLGRVHGSTDIYSAIEAARLAGFDNVNVDLMYGLPGQRVTQAIEDLKQAIELQPSHISWYELTIERNTAFFTTPPRLPDEETLSATEHAGLELLADAGYRRYEISAFCRGLAARSTHNCNYWQFGDYIGIGAGAHGKISFPEQQRIERHWKTRSPVDYLRAGAGPAAGTRNIEADQLPLEYMMNALRLIAGVREDDFEHRTGMGIAKIAATLQDLRDSDLMRRSPELCTTAKGLKFLDTVLLAFEPTDPGKRR